ncbi:MAG TPA: 2-oxoacid:acceptor oxidoreductase family protein, partial [Sedimentisphaerales bacterium]|nr:2-oxoacid:acceptor oxidoreductase family protein [Sedimentisphaerales bacterium]
MHRDDLSIVLCGQAGQGVQTVEFLLTRLLKLAGYHVFATKEYMSRVRGGLNSTTIRVSNHEVAAYVHRMDILVPLSGGAVEHVAKRISPGTVVLGEQKVIGDGPVLASCRVLEVPFTKIAQEIGNALYSNSVAVGAVAGALGLDLQPVTDYVRRFFAGKQASVGEDNVRAAQAGYKAVESLDVDELAIDLQPARAELHQA